MDSRKFNTMINETERLKSSVSYQIRCLKAFKKLHDVSMGYGNMLNLTEDHLRELTKRLPWTDDMHKVWAVLQLDDVALSNQVRSESTSTTKVQLKKQDKIYAEIPRRSFIGWFMEQASTGGNAPYAFYFWNAISLLSAASRFKLYRSAAKTIYYNTYIILSGPRGGGKSSSQTLLKEIVKTINAKINAKAMESVVRGDIMKSYEWKDKLLTRIPNEITPEKLVSLLNERQYFEADVTPAEGSKLTNVKRHDATGYIILDELATFMGKDIHNSSKMIPLLTQIYEDHNYTKGTKKDGAEDLYDASLTMIAACAPDWLAKTIDRTAIGGGFMDRTIWCYRDPDFKASRENSLHDCSTLNTVQIGLLADWIINHVLCFVHKEEIEHSPEAEARFKEIEQDIISQGEESFIRDGLDAPDMSAGRMTTKIIQLAGLMALSEQDIDRDKDMEGIVVSAQHIDLAYRILLLEHDSFETVIGEATRSDTLARDAKVRRWVEENGCQTKSELNRKFVGRGGMPDTKDLDVALENLKQKEELFKIPIRNGVHWRSIRHHQVDGCYKCNPNKEQ